MRYLVLIGRILYASVFLLAITYHFKNETIQWAASKGVPMPNVLVPLSGVIAFLGGLSIAIGFRTRIGAWLIIIFLIPVTCIMHSFWKETDPMMMQMQGSNFTKNMSMLGAALILTWFGPGPLSMDENVILSNEAILNDLKPSANV